MKTFLTLLLFVCLLTSTTYAQSQQALRELNIVYFVPADMEPFPKYEERLNRVLKEMQKFYNRELQRNHANADLRFTPHPNDQERINLLCVRGKLPASGYPYEGGGAIILPELEAYYAAHPQNKKSEHTLVIMPSTSGNPLNPGGVPFYGYGKFCFALDYPDFDYRHCGEKTDMGRLFTKWYGGMAHELGHGLGLPHNHATRSDEKSFGTALMGAGNHSLGQSPTFLTAASCAILESSEPCRRLIPRAFVPVNDIDISIQKENGSVQLSGKLPPDCSVRKVIAAYDKDEWESVNNNYDAEAFIVPVAKDGTFNFRFPMDEIHPGKTALAQVQVRLIHDNGVEELIRHTLP
ncbi:MAG: hypothetical protein RR133_03370 [Kiritimatiellia bacterium]